MISLSEVNAAANKFKVSSETIEKDYIISWVLSCLSKSQLKKDFVFYGGTAIKRIYFEDHRFSEDIDLISTQKFSQDYLLKELNILEKAKNEANIVLNINQNSINTSKGRIQMLIEYSGYDEIVGSPKEIRLDFVMNSDLFWKISEHKIIESYSDLKPQEETLFVMTLNTILSNKLGLLIDSTRNEPRDFFDVWFLLTRRKKFNFNLDEISATFKKKYSFTLSPHMLIEALKNPSLKKHWTERLEKQISELPDISTLIKEVEAIIKKLFLM